MYIKELGGNVVANAMIQLCLDQILHQEDIAKYSLQACSLVTWCPIVCYTTRLFKVAILEHYNDSTHPQHVDTFCYDTGKKSGRERSGEERNQNNRERQSASYAVANGLEPSQPPVKKLKVLSQ